MAYSSVAKKMKKRNPRADPDHHQNSTTSRRSPLARACQDWSTSVSAFVSVLSCLPPLIRQVASDSTSTQYCRRSALYKLLCMYVCMYVCIRLVVKISESQSACSKIRGKRLRPIQQRHCSTQELGLATGTPSTKSMSDLNV